MCVEMDLCIVKIVYGHINNTVFCGLARSITGALNVIKEVYPKSIDGKIESYSSTRMIILLDKDKKVYALIELEKRDVINNVEWVVTKRNNEGYVSDTVWGVFDTKNKAEAFVDQNVEDPIRTIREKCKIEEIDGYKPFHRIIGDENPELNKVHYTIYMTEVKD